ncbi:MAG: Uma2 family endonuclease [Candidatus Rokuibacteriota bacterium]
MSVQLIRHRFTVDEYHALGRAGVLTEDDRVELIEGEIVDMTPIGLRHAAAVNVLTRWLVAGCGVRAIVQIQGPLRLGPHSELQPDGVLLQPRDDFYRTAPPAVEDVLLLVEVADTSLPYDRTVKLPLYARVGLREVWLVDLVRDQVEVSRDPGPDGYRTIAAHTRGERLVPLAFPDLSFSVDELLG